jgi:hypothetical protein
MDAASTNSPSRAISPAELGAIFFGKLATISRFFCEVSLRSFMQKYKSVSQTCKGGEIRSDTEQEILYALGLSRFVD